MGKESERREGLAKLRLREGPEHQASSPDAAALTTEGEAGWLQEQEDSQPEHSAPHLWRQRGSARKVSSVFTQVACHARRHILRPTLAHVWLNLPLQKERR